MEEITVEELKKKNDQGDSYLLLDVREPFEANISTIGGQLIPLDQLPGQMEKLPAEKDKEIIVLCRSGGRSAKAQKLLLDNGYSNVKNLKGGINQWARTIDKSLPEY
ncbi:MAG: rhodanese-like domain-containing protein [Balneolaceae bacterium]